VAICIYQHCSTGQIPVKFDIVNFFKDLLRKYKFCQKWAKMLDI